MLHIVLGGSVRFRKCVLTFIADNLKIENIDVNVVTLREYLKWPT